MTVLGVMRRAGVKFSLAGGDLDVIGATPEQIERIKAAKPQIVAALVAEGMTGKPRWENTALGAGLEITYNQVVDCMERGVWPADCQAVIDLIDMVMEAESVALYQEVLPQMATLIEKIEGGRRQLLEGRHLLMAAQGIFKPAMPHQQPPKPLNGSIF